MRMLDIDDSGVVLALNKIEEKTTNLAAVVQNMSDKNAAHQARVEDKLDKLVTLFQKIVDSIDSAPPDPPADSTPREDSASRPSARPHTTPRDDSADSTPSDDSDTTTTKHGI